MWTSLFLLNCRTTGQCIGRWAAVNSRTNRVLLVRQWNIYSCFRSISFATSCHEQHWENTVPWDKKNIRICGLFAGPYLLRVWRYKNKNIKKLNWKQDLQTLSAPTNSQFYILRISLLICSYVFQRDCHPQGDYTNVIKMYRNKRALQ